MVSLADKLGPYVVLPTIIQHKSWIVQLTRLWQSGRDEKEPDAIVV